MRICARRGNDAGVADAGDAAVEDCPVPANCTDLLARRASLVADYRVAEAHGDLASLPAIGACIVAVVAAERASPDLCGVADCQRICVLHDCSSVEPAQCVAECDKLYPSLGRPQADAIVQRAAMTPLCTCDICSADSASFCETMWGCTSG